MSTELTTVEKTILSEKWVNSCNHYTDFYNEFVKTFNLNLVQCCALNRLCALKGEYAEYTAEAKAAELSIDEMLTIYDKYIAESVGDNGEEKIA